MRERRRRRAVVVRDDDEIRWERDKVRYTRRPNSYLCACQGED